ncbi:hypothetical protein MKEN_00474500 [Mycena kentingensis (nom. inval.)]|nr:hypothetical protein MKEN_00474500 [Mycena kentingensis (nom. inval.)]
MPICQYCPPEKQVNRAAGSSHNSHLASCPHKKQKIAAAQAAAREREEQERAEEERLAAERSMEQLMEDIQVSLRVLQHRSNSAPPTAVQFANAGCRHATSNHYPNHSLALPYLHPRLLPIPTHAKMAIPRVGLSPNPTSSGSTKYTRVNLPTIPTAMQRLHPSVGHLNWWKPLRHATMPTRIHGIARSRTSTQAEYMRYHVLVDNKNSIASGNKLLDLMRDPAFKAADLDDFTVEKGFKILDGFDETPPGAPPNAWRRGKVTLQVPPGRNTDKDILEITLEEIFYRSPLDIIREVFCSSQFEGMHTTPFSLRWDPKHKGAAAAPDAYAEPGSIPRDDCGLPVLPPGHQELYGEMFSAHRTLQSYEKLPDCEEEEAVIVSLMPYSDGTSLAQFGTASLQPGYLFIGNQPKSERGKPSVHAAHHFVYFPTLPDDLDEIFLKHYGHSINADIKAHLKRELFHAVWELILDDEFVEAFRHGFPEDCWDKIRRRFFPRFSIYSTDYMEKILAATIKFLARRPCPRCLVLKANIPRTGMESDLNARQSLRRDDIPWRNKVDNARKKIFEGGRAVNGTAVNNVLGENSFVPVKNAFRRLGEPDSEFNLFDMFVPDLLHEIELGVFKAVFTHMIRVLYATDKQNVSYLDERFRKILPFGRTTIRRFTGNVSEMKKMAARDFEDILQNFLVNCRSHVRWCLEGKPDPKPEYTAEQLLEVDFRNNRMYPHATCKVNFTTYDMQRDQDIISPRTRPNVMLRSEDPDDSHPYWYARVLSILHADVKIPGMASYQRIEYLFVRWYTCHPLHRCLPDHPGMPMLSFVPFDDAVNDAFGFIDPNALIRGSHIIPAFEHGQTDELLPPSAVARPASDEDQDWTYYYVNGVVDRDIFMRYQRDAVGHGEVWEGTTAPLSLGRDGVDEMDEDAGPEGEEVHADDEEDESEAELDDFWNSESEEDEECGEDEPEGGAAGDEDAPLVGDDAEYDLAGIDPS